MKAFHLPWVCSDAILFMIHELITSRITFAIIFYFKKPHPRVKRNIFNFTGARLHAELISCFGADFHRGISYHIPCNTLTCPVAIVWHTFQLTVFLRVTFEIFQLNFILEVAKSLCWIDTSQVIIGSSYLRSNCDVISLPILNFTKIIALQRCWQQGWSMNNKSLLDTRFPFVEIQRTSLQHDCKSCFINTWLKWIKFRRHSSLVKVVPCINVWFV